VKPLLVNKFVTADLVQECIAFVQDGVAKEFVSALVDAPERFDDWEEFSTWLESVGITSDCFRFD